MMNYEGETLRYASYVFSFALSVGVFIVLYKYFRKCYRVTVNCWFCNINTRVPFETRREWYCPHCEQFNGFKEDGDYSKPVLEQYGEKGNLPQKVYTTIVQDVKKRSNGLCRLCNANQELKVKQLALYVPFREENYDQEIEIFRNKLDEAYKLCRNCELILNNTLKAKATMTHHIPLTEHSDKREQNFRTRIMPYLKNYGMSFSAFLLLPLAVACYIFMPAQGHRNDTKFISTMWSIMINRWSSINPIDILKQYLQSTRVLPDVLSSLSVLLFLTSYESGKKLPLILSTILMILGLESYMLSDSEILTPTGFKIFTAVVSVAYLLLFYTLYLPSVTSSLTASSVNEKNYITGLSKLILNEDITEKVTSEKDQTPSVSGKLSALKIGGSTTKRISPNHITPPYACNRPLISPPKLTVANDLRNTPFTASRFTTFSVSSGYNSTCVLGTATDHRSDFDSVSRVSNRAGCSYISSSSPPNLAPYALVPVPYHFPNITVPPNIQPQTAEPVFSYTMLFHAAALASAFFTLGYWLKSTS